MATEEILQSMTFPAHADYHAYQYYIMKLSSSGRAQKCSSAGEAAVGVLQDKPTAQDIPCLVGVYGKTKVIYGDTVTIMNALKTDASGKAVPASPATDTVIGIATKGGSANDIGEMLIGKGAITGVVRTPSVVTFSVDAADIADGDVVTEFVPGFAGTLTKFFAVCTKAVTTAAKATTLNLEIGTTNVTDGTIALSGKYALGKTVDNTANPSALNTFGATDKISIEASSTTTFSEGRFDLCIVLA